MLTGDLAATAQQLTNDRVPFVLATVVRARRPTSVRAGDCALIHSDGTIEGFVGGACAESTVRLYSLRALETGEPTLLRLVPAPPGAAPEAGDGFDGAVVEHNPCLSGGALEIFLEPRLPAPRMLIAGDGPVAAALARVAAAAGYDVAAGAGAELQPSCTDAALVVASHGSDEEDVLSAALTAGVPYVGLVASARRGEAGRAALAVADALRAQLHTPAGLKLGARTPEEIAIAILAEIVSERRTVPSPAGVAPTREAVDPVCGMHVAASDATPHLDRDGHREYFCSDGCRDAFAARLG